MRLGMPDAIADYLGTDGLFDFLEKYPDISLENRISNNIPNMETLEADICLDFRPPSSPNLVLIAVKEIRCGLFTSQKYIDRYGVPKDVDDLINNHRICDKCNHELFVEGWKYVKDNAKHLVYVTNSIFSMRSVLLSGLGIGICSFPSACENKSLLHVNLKGMDFSIPIYLLAHRDTKDMPRIRVVLDYIKDLFQNASEECEIGEVR